MSKIVVIDDDLDLLKVVKSLLLKRGFQVSVFSDWNAAISEIKKERPHLILLDVFLGNTDGLEVCKKLKSDSSTRSIPVIILSAFPKVARTAVHEFGARDFISKPFECEEFISKIGDHLSRTRGYA